ncbi:peptide/nickel transport system permease protein [Evansella vedderi]|uniref:Peptide/nickel transport system permease protein n=1 Tax=Evansella vedderi TaxID=38282 RepID=A0ABT9ZZP1_9BACI|nr:ABC transporter permease [Evansella vedderi]MDQ0256430.1 peptide/nickel transport system permease protein [Evansella vedderi]
MKTNQLTFLKWLKMLGSSKTGSLGAIIILTVTFTASFASFIAPHDVYEVNLNAASLPPSWMDGGESQYVLGTDRLGRDLFSRVIYGSQISLLVGISAVIVAGVIGVPIGLISGYYGGFIDSFFMRIVDANIAIPVILIALFVLGFLNPNLIMFILVVGVATWYTYARVVRSEVLSLKEREFIKAARVTGVRNSVILIRHLLPNVTSSVIVVSTLSVATTIIIESSLSFLGLGPKAITWGALLSDGRDYLATSWWIATFPGIAITITVLGIILLGDWLRDVLDPHSHV